MRIPPPDRGTTVRPMRPLHTSRIPIRGVAASLAVLFTLAVGGQALGARSCPHHDAAPAGVAAGSEAADASGTDPADGPDHPCNCIGTCHPGATAAPPTTASLPTPVAPPVRDTGPVAPDHTLAPVREPGFLLHRPNAPPA